MYLVPVFEYQTIRTMNRSCVTLSYNNYCIVKHVWKAILLAWETSRDDSYRYWLFSCLLVVQYARDYSFVAIKNKNAESCLHFFAEWPHKCLNIKYNWVNPNPNIKTWRPPARPWLRSQSWASLWNHQAPNPRTSAENAILLNSILKSLTSSLHSNPKRPMIASLQPFWMIMNFHFCLSRQYERVVKTIHLLSVSWLTVACSRDILLLSRQWSTESRWKRNMRTNQDLLREGTSEHGCRVTCKQMNSLKGRPIPCRSCSTSW